MLFPGRLAESETVGVRILAQPPAFRRIFNIGGQGGLDGWGGNIHGKPGLVFTLTGFGRIQGGVHFTFNGQIAGVNVFLTFIGTETGNTDGV